MKLNDHKAGMQGLDTNKINQIIEDASKGSKFYQHKQKNQERINVKIADMKAACDKLTAEQKKLARAKVKCCIIQTCSVSNLNVLKIDGQFS